MTSTTVTCTQGTQCPAPYTHFIVMSYGWHQKTVGQDRWVAEVMAVLQGACWPRSGLCSLIKNSDQGSIVGTVSGPRGSNLRSTLIKFPASTGFIRPNCLSVTIDMLQHYPRSTGPDSRARLDTAVFFYVFHCDTGTRSFPLKFYLKMFSSKLFCIWTGEMYGKLWMFNF